jgi:hypothetical protein
MIAIAARREAPSTAPTDFGDRGQVSKLSPPGNNGARAVQRDAPYERRSRTPAWSTTVLPDKALSALPDRLRFASESLDEAERARKQWARRASAPRAGLDRRAKQEGRQQEKLICEMRLAHGALGMTTVFPRVRSANRPRMTGPPAQTNSLPAAAPSWRQCCESCGLWSRLVGFTASSSSRALGATGEVCRAGTIH